MHLFICVFLDERNLDFVYDLNIEKIEKIKDGLEWFHLNHEHLKRYYLGQYVVIKDQKIVDYDKSLEQLLERLQIRDYRDYIAIELVYQ
jgi:hypothetical protein